MALAIAIARPDAGGLRFCLQSFCLQIIRPHKTPCCLYGLHYRRCGVPAPKGVDSHAGTKMYGPVAVEQEAPVGPSGQPQ